jgi:hypothetical protein
MVLKRTLERTADGSWQLAQGQEPLMDESQLRRPETVLGCPVEPGTLADSLVFKPRAEIFVQRLGLEAQEIELRTPTAAVPRSRTAASSSTRSTAPGACRTWGTETRSRSAGSRRGPWSCVSSATSSPGPSCGTSRVT